MVTLSKGTRAYSVDEIKNMITAGDFSFLDTLQLQDIAPGLQAWLNCEQISNEPEPVVEETEDVAAYTTCDASEIDVHSETIPNDDYWELIKQNDDNLEIDDEEKILSQDAEDCEDSGILGIWPYNDSWVNNPYKGMTIEDPFETDSLHLYEMKSEVCPLHCKELKEINVRIQYADWKKYGMILYLCEKCNHLFLNDKEFREIKPYFDEMDIDYTYFKGVRN